MIIDTGKSFRGSIGEFFLFLFRKVDIGYVYIPIYGRETKSIVRKLRKVAINFVIPKLRRCPKSVVDYVYITRVSEMSVRPHIM